MKRAVFSSVLGLAVAALGLALPSAHAAVQPTTATPSVAPAASADPVSEPATAALAITSAAAFGAANPARLLDSRPGTSTVDGQFAATGALAAGATVELIVNGRGGVADGRPCRRRR